MSGSGASTSAAARRGLPEIDYAAPVWVGKSDCWHGSVTTRSVMAVRLMQFGVDQLVVTGSVVMRQSSRSRRSDESGPPDGGNGIGLRGGGKHDRTAVGRARRPRASGPRTPSSSPSTPLKTPPRATGPVGEQEAFAYGGFSLPRTPPWDGR